MPYIRPLTEAVVQKPYEEINACNESPESPFVQIPANLYRDSAYARMDVKNRNALEPVLVFLLSRSEDKMVAGTLWESILTFKIFDYIAQKIDIYHHDDDVKFIDEVCGTKDIILNKFAFLPDEFWRSPMSGNQRAMILNTIDELIQEYTVPEDLIHSEMKDEDDESATLISTVFNSADLMAHAETLVTNGLVAADDQMSGNWTVVKDIIRGVSEKGNRIPSLHSFEPSTRP